MATGAATNHRTLDEARLLLTHGDFAAASHPLRHLPRTDDVKQIIRIADFHAAWDRLNYRTADDIHVGEHAPSGRRRDIPSKEARRWVHHLAQPFPDRSHPDYCVTMSARLRRLIVNPEHHEPNAAKLLRKRNDRPKGRSRDTLIGATGFEPATS